MELNGRFSSDELRLPSSLSYTIGSSSTTNNNNNNKIATGEFLPERFSSSPAPTPLAPAPTAAETATTPTSHLREAPASRHGNGLTTEAAPAPIQTLADPVLASGAPRPTSATAAAAIHGFAAVAASTASSNHVRTPPSATTPRRAPAANVRYRECLKNHAAAVGGHVIDGCGEFMPGGSGDEVDDEFKCSVCGCHRSFHRKEVEGEGAAATAAASSHQRHPYYSLQSHYPLATSNGVRRVPQPPAPPPLLALPPPHYRPLNPIPMMSFGGRAGPESGGGGGTTTDSSSEEMDAHTPVAGGERHMVFSSVAPPPPSVLSRKRFRTKFTAEQRERMMCFADAMGWRMHRKDDAALEQFCADIGVSRQVFKVWMHNNKHISAATRKLPDDHYQQEQQQQQPPPPTPP